MHKAAKHVRAHQSATTRASRRIFFFFLYFVIFLVFTCFSFVFSLFSPDLFNFLFMYCFRPMFSLSFLLSTLFGLCSIFVHHFFSFFGILLFLLVLSLELSRGFLSCAFSQVVNLPLMMDLCPLHSHCLVLLFPCERA